MERYRKPEVPQLNPGITPIPVPDFGTADVLGDPVALPPEETLANIKRFFDEITAQGGELVGIITVPVHLPEPGYIDDEQDMQVFLIKK